MFDVNGLRCRDRPALTFSLQAGELVCLSGPSGSGKTQLLRALADLDLSEGEVKLGGVLRQALPAVQWRRRVAFLPAESRWWAASVGEHFAALDRQQLGCLGLDAEAGNWCIERLSSGEKQRLALLRLLAGRPEVLLLDEPTANLDAANIEKVETLIAQYLQTTAAACLWVSHDRQQRERLGARCLRMTADGGLLP